MSEPFPLHDSIIFQEMMSHPAIFSHPRPKKIAILGDENGGILLEVLKHPSITHIWHASEHALKLDIDDVRASLHAGNIDRWIANMQIETLDILIVAQDANPHYFDRFASLLNDDGMMIQQSESPFYLTTLKKCQQELSASGFSDIHFLTFTQPHFPTGCRTAIIARKHNNFRRIREKDIFNKTFSTRFYNFDVHKASLVLPEFMREELETLEE
jgi:spermidine synthase